MNHTLFLQSVFLLCVSLYSANVIVAIQSCDKIKRNLEKNVHEERTEIINIHSGKVRGNIIVNVLNGLKYSSFKGIPYAKPPIGKRRFLPPYDVKSWTNVFDATKHGNICPQMDFDDESKFLGNEDCLFINVYTPVVDFRCNKNNAFNSCKKAVMVWIHGGGFYFGSGDSSYFGPDFLLSKDVIVVTFNYRLGAPGFLNMKHPLIPGNAGLKDQALALLWVKRNIAKFGGDPENVTIFGQSAGGASVDMHLISNMSRGLFHRSIALSGSVFCRWAFTNNPFKHAKKLAYKLNNFNGYNSLNMIRQFLNTNITDLTKKAAKLIDVTSMELPFVPSIEAHDVSLNNTFLDQCYDEKFKAGNFFQGQHILGHTNAETNIFYRQLDDHLKNLFRKDGISQQRLEENSTTVQDFENSIKFLRQESIIEKYSYELFESPIELKLQYIMKYGGSNNIYHYIFGYEEENRFMISGAMHGDDLAYIFYIQGKKQNCKQYSMAPGSKRVNRDILMRDRMISMLTNFAKYGNPSIYMNQNKIFNWKASNKNGASLKITKDGSFKMFNKRLLKYVFNGSSLCEEQKPDSYDLLTDAFIEIL